MSEADLKKEERKNWFFSNLKPSGANQLLNKPMEEEDRRQHEAGPKRSSSCLTKRTNIFPEVMTLQMSILFKKYENRGLESARDDYDSVCHSPVNLSPRNEALIKALLKVA